MSRKSRRKSLGAVLACLLALVLTGGAVLAGLVFSDPGADASPPQPVAEERAGEMLRSLLGGEPFTPLWSGRAGGWLSPPCFPFPAMKRKSGFRAG